MPTAHSQRQCCIATDGTEATTALFRQRDGHAVLCTTGQRTLVRYIGEATPYELVAAFAELIAKGKITGGSDLLLDFSQYTGMIDWNFAKSMAKERKHQMLPPGRIAYVVHDLASARTVKGLITYVGGSECQIFLDILDAFDWLDWRDPSDGHSAAVCHHCQSRQNVTE